MPLSGTINSGKNNFSGRTRSSTNRSQASRSLEEQIRQKTLLQEYLQQIAQQIDRVKRYPKQAKRKGWQGTVTLKIRIVSSGEIHDAIVQGASRYNALNKSALQSIKDLERFPPFPKGLEMDSLSVRIPVTFELIKSRGK